MGGTEPASVGKAPNSKSDEDNKITTWDGVFDKVEEVVNDWSSGADTPAPTENTQLPHDSAAAEEPASEDIEPQLRDWLKAVLAGAGFSLAADQSCRELFMDGVVLAMLIEQLTGQVVKIKESTKPAVQLDSLQVLTLI